MLLLTDRGSTVSPLSRVKYEHLLFGAFVVVGESSFIVLPVITRMLRYRWCRPGLH